MVLKRRELGFFEILGICEFFVEEKRQDLSSDTKIMRDEH